MSSSLQAISESSDLVKVSTKGWQLHVPPFKEGVKMRERSELQKLVSDIMPLVSRSQVNGKVTNESSYLRRLARKLKYRLSAHTSCTMCSCKNLNESCAGIVCGPAYTLENIHCTFTSRVLPPLIFQTFEMEPPWVKMMQELHERTQQMLAPLDKPKITKRPLTFAHMTPSHVAAIRCLSATYFWSNIDVSMALKCPEFTCVVLYGKLVVGFGYLSPGAYTNEGYINFLFVRPHWRRSGIGELILYLLRQQCMYWTLTLHVSPTSDALNLYHKFGFKTYSRIKNFYSGYVISNTKGDEDALFMKLESKLPQIF